jgi:hypothetical protein
MDMNFRKLVKGRINFERGLLLGGFVLALAGCSGTGNTPHVSQPQIDVATGQPIIEAGDIAIAGQIASHAINDLPDIASAAKPPLVRFAGVTSALNGPVDTTPYTNLLRDRLLLLTREKLRFVERELPPLTPHHVKHSKEVGGALDVDTDADYRLTAQLRGNIGDDNYLVFIQLVDLHSGQDAFSGLYRIRPEDPGQASMPMPAPSPSSNPDIEPTNPMPAGNSPPRGSDSSGF